MIILLVGCCEHGDKPSDSTESCNFIEQLCYYQLLRRTVLYEIIEDS
jgi:hypothetical protein